MHFWIEIVSYTRLSYKVSELVVSIRQTKEMTNEDKDWKSKRLAVEEYVAQWMSYYSLQLQTEILEGKDKREEGKRSKYKKD